MVVGSVVWCRWLAAHTQLSSLCYTGGVCTYDMVNSTSRCIYMYVCSYTGHVYCTHAIVNSTIVQLMHCMCVRHYPGGVCIRMYASQYITVNSTRYSAVDVHVHL